jgi:hypothetical protein
LEVTMREDEVAREVGEEEKSRRGSGKRRE